MTCRSTVTRPANQPYLPPKRGELWEIDKEECNLVVLVTMDHTLAHRTLRGIVVNTAEAYWHVGQYHEEFDIKQFKRFHGTVTLQQD